MIRCPRGPVIVAGLLAAASAAWAQGSPASAPEVGRAFFGMHVHRLVPTGQLGARATPWPDMPLGLLRLWDAELRWADLEPQPGRWDFARFDRIMQMASEQGVQVIYVLGSTPRWASARPAEPCPYGQGCAAEPADLDRWSDYVRTVAQRYRGRIAWYEVWNEPHPQERAGWPQGAQPGFYSGTWPTLLQLTQRARQAVQEADPQARLLTPGFDGDPASVERFLAAGGKQWVDGVSFHFYGDDDAHVVPLTRRLRAIMARQGLGPLPLFNTESGFGAPETTTTGRAPQALQSAAWTARAMVLGAFAGLDGWVHYAWDNGHTGLVDRASGQPTVLAGVYRRAQSWLMGLVPQGCTNEAGVVVCRGRQGGRARLIVWRPAGEARPWPVPAGWEAAEVEPALDVARSNRAAGGRSLEVGAMPLSLVREAAP